MKAIRISLFDMYIFSVQSAHIPEKNGDKFLFAVRFSLTGCPPISSDAYRLYLPPLRSRQWKRRARRSIYCEEVERLPGARYQRFASSISLGEKLFSHMSDLRHCHV